MEEQLLEQPKNEASPALRRYAPPLKSEEGSGISARRSDAPLFAAPGGGTSARGWDAPPEPLPVRQGSRVPRGLYGEGSSHYPFREKVMPCAAISVNDEEQGLNPMEDYNFNGRWDENSDEEEGEEMQPEVWNTLRRMIRENTRLHYEETLNQLPSVISARVELGADNGTLGDGVHTRVAINFNEEFAEVRDIMLRDKNYTDQHILWHVKGITKFVEDVKKGNRNIEEISNQWNFERCLEIIYGERKEKEENPKKEVYKTKLSEEKEFNIENLAEQIEDRVILSGEGKEPDTESVSKPEYINLIMFKKKRKKRGKKHDRKESHDPA